MIMWPPFIRSIVPQTVGRADALEVADNMLRIIRLAAEMDLEAMTALTTLATYVEDQHAEADALGIPRDDDQTAWRGAILRMRDECIYDASREAVKSAKATQARAAAKKPRKRPSPYPAWMHEIARDRAYNDRLTASRAAEVAYDAIRTHDPDAAPPSVKTVAEWIANHRRERLFRV